MGPIDYGQQVQQPFMAAAQGMQMGNAIVDRQRQDAEYQAAIQQREQQKQGQAQMSQDLFALSSKKDATGQDYAAMMTRYPALAENLKRGWDVMSQEQQQNALGDASQVYAALHAGKPELAFDMLNTQAAAKMNAGDEKGSKLLADMARAVQANPDAMRTSLGLRMSALPGGDKVLAGLKTMGEEQRAQQLQPLEVAEKSAGVAKTVAEARKAGVEADVLPEVTRADIGEKNSRTTKNYADIEAERVRQEIAGLDIQIKQANSQTDRLRLQTEREKLQAELTQKQSEKVNAGQDTLDGLTQSLTTVDAVMKHPGLTSGTGRGGDIAAWFNGSDAADFRAQLAVLKSQAFLSSVAGMKGTGALSDAEGKRLESAIAALETAQSPGQMRSQLGVIKSTLEKAQAKVISRGQAPVSGGAVTLTNPVSRQTVTEGDINAMMRSRPGATREQVLNFLQSKGFR